MWEFLRYLRGYYKITFRSPAAERILRYTVGKNIPIWEIQKEEGSLSFCITHYHKKYLAPFFSSLLREESYEEEERGILRLWKKIVRHPGLVAGAVFFALSLYASSLFVWSVEIQGNANLSEWELREEIKKLGLREGARLDSLNASDLSFSIQIQNPKLSFASVRFVGTRAVVEVREREELERKEETVGMQNLVAKISGRILRYEVLEGRIQVARDDYVTEGDLLISGVINRANGTFSTVCAEGRVFAQTEREFVCQIPLEEEEVVYTGREETRETFSLLGISFPFFSTAFPFDSFETVVTKEQVNLFGKNLPLWVTRTEYLETEEKIRRITVDRARILAYDKYEEYKRGTFASDTEILEESVFFEETEQFITLRVNLVLSEDICRPLPFNCVTIP